MRTSPSTKQGSEGNVVSGLARAIIQAGAIALQEDRRTEAQFQLGRIAAQIRKGTQGGYEKHQTSKQLSYIR